MTFCLYECLRAVGLQQHYARFTLAGVCRAAHLSELTMEDYPHLGICTMEERTRLFDLVQMIKSLDLDILGSDEDDNFNSNAAAAQDIESYAGLNEEFKFDGSGNTDDHGGDEENEALSRESCIHRRLSFSTDSTDCHQKLSFCPVGSVNVNASHDSSTQHIQGRALAMPVQLHNGSPVVCNCKGNKFKSDVDSFPSDHHLEENFNPAITRGTSMHNSDNILLPRCASFQNPKPRSTIASSETFTNKKVGPQSRKRISRKQSLCPDMKRIVSLGSITKPTPVFEAKRAASYNYGLPLNVPVTPSKRRVGEHRITVCVRKRPLTRAENRRKESDVVTAPSGECVIVHESKDAVDLSQYILEHRFYFDHVFDEGNSNEDVYQNTAYPLVQHMLNGGNATCFAYGQTGAGKTHTMLGSPPGRPGLYALAVRDIFVHLSATRTHPSLQVFVSFFEIYCGQLYDLLDDKKRLFAREDGQKMVHISGLRHVRVDSVNSLLEVISHGTKTRTQGISGVNPCSSRSHALLQIQLRNSNQQIAGRMWFVDLAGSERASDTKEPNKQSRMEGAEINQSLLALKECIRALDREQSHTPFRQSKLTQVLKNAFIGDSMTCMIANISPGHGATEHTLNTLRYADRVKELRGQGGLRGRRGSKTVPSSKHNLSNSNSSRGSVGSRGLNENLNLGKQKEDFGSSSLATKLCQRNITFCSTPKNSRCGKEANAIDREEIGLEHVTPIRMWLGVGEKSNGSIACGDKRENKRYSSSSVSRQSFKEGPIMGQQMDRQLDSWVQQKERAADRVDLSFAKTQSELDHSEKVTPQFTVTERSGDDRKWIELRRRVESSGDTNSKAEKEPKRDFQNVDCSNEERKMHLRRYHKELQKFIPSASSSFHLEAPGTQTSVSSSIPTSFLHHSSCFSVSTNGYSGTEEYLDTDAARGEVRTEASRGQFPLTVTEVHSLNESSTFQHSNHSEVRCEQVKGENQKKLEGATGAERERKRSPGTNIQRRRLAWGAAQEKGPANVTTFLTNATTKASDSNDSEDRKQLGLEMHNASDSPADGMCSTKQEGTAGPCSVMSACGPFSLSLESPSQQAPAERPLSPAGEHTNTFSTSGKLSDICLEFSNAECNANVVFPPLKNSSEAVPLNRYSENKPRFITNAKALKLSKTPTHNKEPETTVLPQNDADSFSFIMDPLSISQLEVDQQPATTSYLQGDNGSLSRFGDEIGEDRMTEVGKDCLTCAEMLGEIAEYEDEEFRLTLLELPQMKLQIQKTPDSRAAAFQTERSEICRLDEIEPLKVSGDILQDQEHSQKPQTAPALGDKDPASPHKHLTCTSLQTPITQHAVKNFMDASLLGFHEAKTNAWKIPSRSPQNNLKKTTSFMLTPQPENVSSHLNVVPNHCHTITSDCDSHSHISFQPNKTATLFSEEDRGCQKTRSTEHLFTLDDLNHAKWSVVKAHWEQLKKMDDLCHEEGMLLHRQPDMPFKEYVHRLEDIMEKKAQCVHTMRAQLQPYLKLIHYNHLEQQQQQQQ